MDLLKRIGENLDLRIKSLVHWLNTFMRFSWSLNKGAFIIDKNSPVFPDKFCRVYRIYGICKILFFIILKMKSTKIVSADCRRRLNGIQCRVLLENSSILVTRYELIFPR